MPRRPQQVRELRGGVLFETGTVDARELDIEIANEIKFG